jgi:hypothetical protein
LSVIRPTTVVVSKLNDGVGVVRGHAVMGEQGVKEGAKHAPLRVSVADVLGHPQVARVGIVKVRCYCRVFTIIN